MEPLLELADRITAHVWLFERACPAESKTLRDAEKQLLDDASEQYAKLQELSDLYDPQGQTGDSNNPFAWIEAEQEQGSLFSRFVASVNEWVRTKPIWERPQQDQAEFRHATAAYILDVLGRRIYLLEHLWDKNRPKSSEEHAEGEGGVNWGGTLREFCNVSVSDLMFRRIASWVLGDDLGIKDKILLARTFFPSPVPGQTRVRFLIEEALDIRAEQLAGGPLIRTPWGTADRTSSATQRIDEQTNSIWAAADWRSRDENKKLELLFCRSRLRTLCRAIDAPVPFSLVSSDELDEIDRLRSSRLQMPVPPSSEANAGNGSSGGDGCTDSAVELPAQRAFRANLFGLALSGGGIRSATFGLGLFQAMADRNVLPYVDVLSCVSGGGYIGSWLLGWIKRRGSIGEVQRSLRGNSSRTILDWANGDPEPENQDPKADHLRPVRLLREYARYLAPDEGLLSADSWTIGATWSRNTILNLTVLMLFFGGILLVPRGLVYLLIAFGTRLSPDSNLTQAQLFWTSFEAALPFALMCLVIYVRNLQFLGRYLQKAGRLSRGDDDKLVLVFIVIPLLLAGYLYTAAIWNLNIMNIANSPWTIASGFASVSILGILLLGCLSRDIPKLKFALVAIACGAVSLLATYAFCALLVSIGTDTMRGVWLAVALGTPLLIAVITATIVAMLGLAGTLLSDDAREWWSRLGAWFAIAVVVWLVLSAICYFMPLWIAMAQLKAAAAGVTWATITAAGIKLAFSPKSSNPESDRKQPIWRSWLLAAAPMVFVLGLLSLTSLVMFWAVNWLIGLDPLAILRVLPLMHNFASQVPVTPDSSNHGLCCTESPWKPQWIRMNYWPLLNGSSLVPLSIAALLILLSKIISSRVDVNEFSMHHFYRNRLVRAYLGASRQRAHRQPNAFTGFDPEDDIRLHRLASGDAQTDFRDLVTDCRTGYAGPFPILNTALNVTKGQDLGVQQRRAESFVFTPLWSGFDYVRKQTQVQESARLEFGFRRTSGFGEGAQGVSIGTAMAISGAAFSSNAGYHTSPALAFLLTVFGVRLGWWAGNPRKSKWSVNSPSDGFSYLWKELTASTTTDEDFVLLTDGGHFENMGLYELVRRRCRFIIVCDAEQDEEFKLEGIGGAIRKCRADFGAVIELGLDALKPLGDPARSLMHYSIGTVRYPGEEGLAQLVYIKASLTDDEPVDVVEFGKRHPEFPHTPTINQMFDESHFESYRELGHHVGSDVFRRNWPTDPVTSEGDLKERLENMFQSIVHDWQKQRDAKLKEQASKCKGANQ